MPSSTSALLALAVASLASAIPFPGSSKTFSCQQSVPKAFRPGPVLLANAYKKYQVDVPDDVAAAANGTGGSAVATPDPADYDREYLVPVTIGGQTLNLDFDTGSADLWVFSSELTSAQLKGHDYYTPSKSKTSKKLTGATWKITYGDQSSASGDVYKDTVNVGGTIVTGQAIELAKTISDQFAQDTDNDGLLGLSFSSINTVTPKQQTTFFDTAISEGALSSNLFTADLKKGAPGTYDFGYIDDSKYTGDITYTTIDNSNGFWEFTGTGYGVGNDSFQSTSLASSIMDTGTTLLLLDDSIVTAYYAKVSGAKYDSTQGGYTFACSSNLPDLTLGVEDFMAVVPGSYINFAPVDTTTCFGGLQSNSGIGFSIWGDIFIKSQFIVFDSDGPQMGVAAKDL